MNDSVNRKAHSDIVIQMMTDIVHVLSSYGIENIPASNVMRLLGTPEDEASSWEGVTLSLDEEGSLQLTDNEETTFSDQSKDNITLH